jgi:hypothetical protein
MGPQAATLLLRHSGHQLEMGPFGGKFHNRYAPVLDRCHGAALVSFVYRGEAGRRDPKGLAVYERIINTLDQKYSLGHDVIRRSLQALPTFRAGYRFIFRPLPTHLYTSTCVGFRREDSAPSS